MLRFALIPAVLLPACGGADPVQQPTHDAASDVVILPDVLDECPGPGRDKIKFPRSESCGNDGGVEWCIPDNDAQLRAMLTAISPTIRCAPGGGRAGCYTGGLLLCSYPTQYPEQCLARWGQAKPEVWDDFCEVAALPQITEIVATLYE
jgi:hypothetical protein